MGCIATFEGATMAILFERVCRKEGFKVKVVPMPRSLSVSCGLACRYPCGEEESIRALCSDRGICVSGWYKDDGAGVPQGSYSLDGSSLHMRLEKKGRGGKTVTVLEGLSMGDESMALLAKDLRKAMGCGSFVQEDALILQGDNRERIASWLEARGVKVKR